MKDLGEVEAAVGAFGDVEGVAGAGEDVDGEVLNNPLLDFAFGMGVVFFPYIPPSPIPKSASRCAYQDARKP